MKYFVLCLSVLLCSCTLIKKQPLSNLEAAKIFIYDYRDKTNTKKHLEQAVQNENSIEAQVLLALLHLKDDYQSRAKAIPLVAPYIETNAEAALIYGLIHYPHDDEKSYIGFKNAARLGHPTGMHYLASHYHHISGQNKLAIEWAFKAIDLGCGKASSYILLTKDTMANKQENKHLLTSLFADLNNGFHQTAMMGNSIVANQKAEHAYWKRRALQTREAEKHRANIPIYDLHKDCLESFNQELFKDYTEYPSPQNQ